MARDQLLPIEWPKSGFIESSSTVAQPPGSTTDCLNVRNYDPIERRNRGGKRTGLSRVIDAQVNGDSDIQLIIQTIEAVPLVESANVGAKFADASPTINSNSFGSIAWHPDGDFIAFVNGGATGLTGAVAFDGTTGFGTQFKVSPDGSSMSGCAWSTDGTHLFVVSDGLITGSHRLVAYPFDKTTGFGTVVTPSTPVTGNLTSCFASPTGGAVAFTEAASPYIRAIAWTGTAFGAEYSAPSTVGPTITGSSASNEACCFNPAGTVIFQAGTSTPFVRAWNWSDASGFGSAFADPGSTPTGAVYNIRHHPTTGHVICGDTLQVRVYPFSTGSGWGSREDFPEDSAADNPRAANFSTSGNFAAIGNSTISSNHVICRAFTGTIGAALTDPATSWNVSTPYSIAWSPNGNFMAMHRGPNTQAVNVYEFNEAQTNPSARRSRLLTTAGGSVYRTDTSLTTYSLVNNGSTALKTSGLIRATQAFQQIFFAEGEADYNYYVLSSNSVLSWHDAVRASAAGSSLPVSASGTAETITGVNTGTSTFTVASVPSDIVIGSIVLVAGSTGNNGSYRVTGTTATTIVVNETIPDATVDGTIALADDGATIIATYRGRVCLSGLRGEPQNWFMSRSGDPFDYNYFPTTTSATQPVAGNNSEAGQLGDIVTAMAPYLDDMLIFGGANSIAVLRGDPAAGGAIDVVAPEVGIVGPEAWAFDNGSNFYFVSRSGLYRMDLNSFQPVLISSDRLDKTFADTDFSSKIVRVAYDPIWLGIHIFISSETTPSTADRHFFYDERNNAFWPDEYPIDHGPVAIGVFKDDNPENSAVFLGGRDGRIRKFDDDAMDDDGTAITSFVRFTPISPGDILASSRIHDITFITDLQSGEVTFRAYVGDTPEAAEANADAGNIRFSRALRAGRNAPMRQRISQNTIIMEMRQVSSTETWAFEKGIARAAVLTRMKGKGV